VTDRKISELTAATSFDVSQIFPDARAGSNEGVTGAQIAASWGGDFHGSTVTSAGATSTSVVTLTWPPGSGVAATRKRLWIDVFVPSYGASPDATGDIVSIRFNGDSGLNYWSRHLLFDAGVWNDVPQASASLIRLAATNSTKSRNIFIAVNNVATRGKTCNIKNQTGSADPATVGPINVGGGEWVNLTDQITSVQLVVAGSNNMGAGTGFIVRGSDF